MTHLRTTLKSLKRPAFDQFFTAIFAGSESTVKLTNTTTAAPTTLTTIADELKVVTELSKPQKWRIVTPPRSLGKNAAQLTARAKTVDAQTGRVAEIIGVTLAFAAVIVIMSVVFILM